MAGQKRQATDHGTVWSLAAIQHGVVARTQLRELGLTPKAIAHRIQRGRLHPVHRGVFAVGRPQLTQHARWMSAVLACGQRALLSDESAARLWGIRAPRSSGREQIDVTIPPGSGRERPGLRIHRRTLDPIDIDRHYGIPVTSPAQTLVHLAIRLRRRALEAAVNEADGLNLVNPEALRLSLERFTGRAGVAELRALLDKHTFVLTESELERQFLPLARRAGLGKPLTRAKVAGHRADFYWPDLGLVVETDGLRYHRTPVQQAKDRRRDQAYAIAGLTPLRFTHAQVAFEPDQVSDTLRAVASRLVREVAA